MYKNKNKVTIIIPTFNEKKYIKKIIEKIEKNINFKKQIILVDDCSKDGTRNIIKKIKESASLRKRKIAALTWPFYEAYLLIGKNE